MFPTRYFGDRYFAPRYFPKLGAAAPPVTVQLPAASRYRYGYRLQWVTRALLFMGLVAEKGAGRCAPPLTRPATN